MHLLLKIDAHSTQLQNLGIQEIFIYWAVGHYSIVNSVQYRNPKPQVEISLNHSLSEGEIPMGAAWGVELEG